MMSAGEIRQQVDAGRTERIEEDEQRAPPEELLLGHHLPVDLWDAECGKRVARP